MVDLAGTPVVLDRLLRPVVRWGALAVGGLGSVLLAVLGAWWWVPVPVVAAWFAAEVWLWRRADRPMRLTIDTTRLEVRDTHGRPLVLDLDEVHAATAHVHHSRHPDRIEVVVTLADVADVRFAARFLVEPDHAKLGPEDVRADAVDAVLGGTGGLRGLAPADAACRQTFDDPAGQALNWLRSHLPRRVWQRTAVRVWAGEAPGLDPFGLHVGPPSALLVLEGDRWSMHDEGVEVAAGDVLLPRAGRAERTATLVRAVGPDDVPTGEMPTETVEIPLLVLELDPTLRVAVPAPEAGRHGPPLALDDHALHVHVPEGGALLWHVLTRWPESAWPVSLRRAARQALAPELPDPSPHRARQRPSAAGSAATGTGSGDRSGPSDPS